MRLSAWGVAVVVGMIAVAAVASEPTRPVVADVEVVGGQTITPDTVEYYLGVAKGDPWDPAIISKNFHRFWDSGLVEDLEVESEEVAPGKIKLIVTVKERPKVIDYEFKGTKKITTSSLKEKLDTAGITLKRNVPLKESELARLVQGIKDAKKAGFTAVAESPAQRPAELAATVASMLGLESRPATDPALLTEPSTVVTGGPR